jgi:hypothetical protein
MLAQEITGGKGGFSGKGEVGHGECRNVEKTQDSRLEESREEEEERIIFLILNLVSSSLAS